MTTKDKTVMTVRLDPELHARLARLADREERPVNWMVNKAIERYVQWWENTLESSDAS